MKKTILFLLVMISIVAAGQGVSKADSIKQKHQMDSVSNLVRTKMSINAAFIDSVFALTSNEIKKFYTLDEPDKYKDALNAQQYFISRLVAAWREQYAKQKKN